VLPRCLCGSPASAPPLAAPREGGSSALCACPRGAERGPLLHTGLTPDCGTSVARAMDEIELEAVWSAVRLRESVCVVALPPAART